MVLEPSPAPVLELDTDMADITQGLPTEGLLGPDHEQLCDGELGQSEHDAISGSAHIASALGINPHTLQVTLVNPGV